MIKKNNNIKVVIFTLFLTFVLSTKNLAYGIENDCDINILSMNMNNIISITKEEKENLINKIKMSVQDNNSTILLMNMDLNYDRNNYENDDCISEILELSDIKYYSSNQFIDNIDSIKEKDDIKVLCSNMQLKDNKYQICEYEIKEVGSKKIAFLGVKILDKYVLDEKEFRFINPKEKILNIIEELKEKESIDEFVIITDVEKNSIKSDMIKTQLNEISKLKDVSLVVKPHSNNLMVENKIVKDINNYDVGIVDKDKEEEVQESVKKGHIGILETELIHDNIVGLSPLGEFLSFNLKEFAHTDIGMINGENIKGKLEKGPISKEDIVSLFKADTEYKKINIKGNDIKKIIESGIKEKGCIQFYGIKVEYIKDKDNKIKVNNIKDLNNSSIDEDNIYNCVVDEKLLTQLDNKSYKKIDEFYLNNECFIDLLSEKIGKEKNIEYSFTNALIKLEIDIENEMCEDEKQNEATNEKIKNYEEEVKKLEKKVKKQNSSDKMLPQTGCSIGSNTLIKQGIIFAIISVSIKEYEKIKKLKNMD